MKKLALLALVCGIAGCHKNEFDVTPAQLAAKKTFFKGPGAMPDMNHLPPGAVKHEMTFKKGDRLPDGSIATGDRKVFQIELPKGSMPNLPDGQQGAIKLESVEETKKP